LYWIIKILICNIEGGDANSLELQSKGATLQDNKTLKDHGIVNSRHMIIAIFSVSGGSQYERLFDKNDPLIKISKQVDCISHEADNHIPRAEMPCGHAISCHNMFQYLKSQVEKLSIIDIICPVPNCKQIWDFDRVASVSNLSNDEYLQYSCILEKRRAAQNNCQCPHCQCFVKRPDNLTHFRVRCGLCKGADFCFVCGMVWKGHGMQICGHDDCSTKGINDTLKYCPMKTPDYVKIQVPQFRACPNCITLIGHKEKCKHMKCYHCKADFCFICLGVKTNGAWACQSHTYECNVAPRQVLS